jgi:hypothetical protein
VGGRDPGPPPSFIPRGNFLLGGSGCPERYGQFGHIGAGSKHPRWHILDTLRAGLAAHRHQRLVAGARPFWSRADVRSRTKRGPRAPALHPPKKPPRRSLGPLSSQVSRLPAAHASSRTNRDLDSHAEGGRPEQGLASHLPLFHPSEAAIAGGSILPQEVPSFFPAWSRTKPD